MAITVAKNDLKATLEKNQVLATVKKYTCLLLESFPTIKVQSWANTSEEMVFTTEDLFTLKGQLGPLSIYSFNSMVKLVIVSSGIFLLCLHFIIIIDIECPESDDTWHSKKYFSENYSLDHQLRSRHKHVLYCYEKTGH